MDCDSIPEGMKSGRELEKEANSIEGIFDRLATLGDATKSDFKDKILIAETLRKLPKRARDKISDEVLFIIMRAVGTATKLVLSYRIDEKDIEKKRIGRTGIIGGCIEQPIIILNFSKTKRPPKSFEGDSESYKRSAVAHEMAHFVLGHHNMSGDPEKEKKADDLTEKWGFKRIYKSYKQFEGTARGQKSNRRKKGSSRKHGGWFQDGSTLFQPSLYIAALPAPRPSP